MKLVIFMLLLAINQISAINVFSQNQMVSMRFNNISFEQLLWEIQKQTDIVFMYGEEDIKQIRNLRIDVNNEEAVDVIRKCLKDTDVEMKIVDNVVVLTRKKEGPERSDQSAQQVTPIEVTGRITDGNGNPLAGATVMIKGTFKGATADNEGRYSLKVPGPDAVLVVSFIGYQTKEVKVGGRHMLDVLMEEGITSLEEVMVVSTGYQEIPKERLSGSYETINGKLFKERPNADIASSLESMALGFQRIIKTNPDGSIYYENRVRGQGTLTKEIANPLIVVDGFPVEDADFSSIDPNIVESVTILKDAAAASIWGARAANGVIVVTTKSGKGGSQFQVEANAFVRISSNLDLDYINPVANTETQIAWEKYVYDNKLTGNLTPSALAEVTNSLTPSLTLYNEYKLGRISEAEYNDQITKLKQYNYQDDVYRYLLRKQVYRQYDLSITGSTDRNNYAFSALYDKTDFHFVGDNVQKALITFKDNFKLNNWLRLQVGATLGLQNSTNEGASLQEISLMPPYQRLVDDDGNYVPMVKDYYLPILNEVSAKGNFPYDDWNYNLLQEVRSNDKHTDSNTIRLQAGLTTTILKGLTWDSKIQYERIGRNTKDVYSEESYPVRNQVNRYNAYDPNTGKVTVSTSGFAFPKGSALDRSSSEYESYVIRNQLQLDRDVAPKHHIMALIGSEVSSYVSKTEQQVRIWGYDDDKLTYANQPLYSISGGNQFHNITKVTLTPGKSWNSVYGDNRFFSLFGNFTYTYNQKYTITGSARTDASNMIVKDPKYRYAPFWSLGGRWDAGQESFVKNVKWIDRLQLRTSYGALGNVVTSSSVVPLISYVTSPNVNTGQRYARVVDFGNPRLRWERTKTLNFGLDYAILDNKLAGKIDLYSKHSKDVLANVDIAGAYGLGYSTSVNAAELTNKGVEVEIITSQWITRELNWKGRLVVSHNKNKIKKLDVYSYYPGGIVSSVLFVEGKPISPVYSYIYEGEENGIPMIRFEDGQKTEIFNIPTVSDARSFMPYEGTLVPTTEMGFTSDFEYKGFDLKTIITGRFGHVFRADAPRYPLMNSAALATLGKPMEEVVNGSPNKFPGLPPATISNLSSYSIVQYFNTLVEDASNIRLKEITLSYNFSTDLLRKLSLSKIRVYSQVSNLGILWKATDTYYDPDFQKFKMPVSYLFGLNVTF
ncbi:MAG: SusC/RagA family TonB-linked outer membrane protein [Mangrovibacterium sp.]